MKQQAEVFGAQPETFALIDLVDYPHMNTASTVPVRRQKDLVFVRLATEND